MTTCFNIFNPTTGRTTTGFKWNTGRMYSANGQEIVAAFDEATSTIWFADLTRYIFGFIEDVTLPHDLEKSVMYAYDYNLYRNASSYEVQDLVRAGRQA